MKCSFCHNELKFSIFTIKNKEFNYCSYCFQKFEKKKEQDIFESKKRDIVLFEYNEYAKSYMQRLLKEGDFLIILLFQRYFMLYISNYNFSETSIYIVNDFLDFQINELLKLKGVKEIKGPEEISYKDKKNIILLYFKRLELSEKEKIRCNIKKEYQNITVFVSLF